jgi:hypothetical protein
VNESESVRASREGVISSSQTLLSSKSRPNFETPKSLQRKKKIWPWIPMRPDTEKTANED